MSGAGVSDFLGYWVAEGERYVKRGDYDWMAAQVPGRRVLEIGCGPGFSTQALAACGLSVLVLDALTECLAAAQARTAGQDVRFLAVDLTAVDASQRQIISEFAPETVVCWLMGAPSGITGAQLSDAGQAVIAYREKLHRLVAELAASLPTVSALHLVDRTVIPWQAKDIGRDTLVGYHAGKTLRDLPFHAERRNALYRKLEDTAADLAQIRKTHPALKGAVATLASLLAERKI
ncbi:MAG: methyltransferase domain-containing protein [Dechloromonas sp.]|nr:MAG: methyltransferase domain-containing protein [Dechloromonas sp.]